ncbi:MAG: HPF/RaiA family ribosome-associated protein [Butyricicoccaceae bacterium]
MKFTIVERKIKIEDELRTVHALRKVEKLDRYFQQDSDTTLTFSELRGEADGRDHGASGWSGCPRRGRRRLVCIASVDGAISSIERQIRKHKTRLGEAPA